MRIRVDERIRNMIDNGVKARHRSMFIIIGDKFRDQIVNLRYMLSKAMAKASPNILWCYKEKLELSSHKKKRAKQIKKLKQRGLLDPEKADAFCLFLETSTIVQCLYRDLDRILGNTYDMCVLQDFEALTPDILAKTIETVEGGGLVVLPLRTLTSLSSLCTMVMDVHARFRTESHSEIVPRFNERFLLSLASCKACLFMDDELNILPISSHVKLIVTRSISESYDSIGTQEAQKALRSLKEKHDSPLVAMCTTLYQGESVSTFINAIKHKDRASQCIIPLISSRGRGKSAALGLAIAEAIGSGLSRIFVTAPFPENVKSLFDFIMRGLLALGYKKNVHYSTCEHQKATTQINMHNQVQMVQYIQPHDKEKLFHADLLVIDEAAAIPLPVIKSLLGPHMVFISSTLNGYESADLSLSSNLLSYFEMQSQKDACSDKSYRSDEASMEKKLKEPVRYASGDCIETWLNNLLCLDAMNSLPKISRLPNPAHCNLYHVNRDTLFSFHNQSEIFLKQMVAIYVSSHYKNSPNDLQLMADAPAHHLFVLLGPVDETNNELPYILCVIQVCLEGEISRKSVLQSLHQGRCPSGDLIPWVFCQEFEDTDFPSLSGVRIVRIAVHPDAGQIGYGSVALDLLTRYYEGKMTTIDETNAEKEARTFHGSIVQAANKVSLLEETIAPRENLPYLLTNIRHRLPEKVNYIGSSFGLNKDLFNFWKKNKFTALYICEKPNDITSEHSCVVLKSLETDDGQHSFLDLTPFYQCFRRKFLRGVPIFFKNLGYTLVMSILGPNINISEKKTEEMESSTSTKLICSGQELKWLESFANNRKDYERVQHLVPLFAYYYFVEKPPINLMVSEASVLLCMGLLQHDIVYTQNQMKLDREQVQHLLRQVMIKFYKYFYDIRTKELGTSFPQERKVALEPHSVSVDEDLNDGAQKVMEKMRSENEGMLNIESLQQYSVENRGAEFQQALQKCSTKSLGILSVESNRKSSEKRIRPERTLLKCRKRKK